MSITFSLSTHSEKPDQVTVEIRKDDKICGVIYPTEEGIRLVSAHIPDATVDPDFPAELVLDLAMKHPFIPSFRVNFKPTHYMITEAGILRP